MSKMNRSVYEVIVSCAIAATCSDRRSACGSQRLREPVHLVLFCEERGQFRAQVRMSTQQFLTVQRPAALDGFQVGSHDGIQLLLVLRGIRRLRHGCLSDGASEV